MSTSEIASHIKRRKVVLLQHACLARAWHRLFPRHDFATGRLRRQYLDGEEIERLAHENKARREKHHNDRRPENWQAMSFGELYDHLNSQRPTPQTTIEAVLYCVRERGVAALNEPANIERLSRCDAKALAQIDARLAKLTKAL